MLRIERTERFLFVGAVAVGIALWTYSKWPAFLRSERLVPWMPVFLVIGVSLLVYALTTRLHAFRSLYRVVPVGIRPCWGVRRHPWIDLFLAIAAGYVAYRIYFQLFEIVTWQLVLTVVVGSGLGLYLVAILANPRSALVVVNCPARDYFEDHNQEARPAEQRQAMINLEKKLARAHLLPPEQANFPLVWPYIFVAQVGGAVVWELNGPEGRKIEIDFHDEDYQPFGPHRTRFVADVPGCLAIGPVVQGGCGSYTVRLLDADGEVLEDVDPGGDNPPGDGTKGGGP